MRSTKSPSWIDRLLGFDPVPVPPHVFSLDGERLRYGQFVRDRHGFRLRNFRQATLPKDPFQHGPLGGPLRDPAAFRELVAGLVKGVPGGIKEASLVLPDTWLRVTFSESSDLPKGGDALDEVLRWKLKRLVPFRVDDLRVSATEVAPLPGQEEPRRLLLGFAVEQLLTQVEEAFAAAGVRLGQVSNVSLSLLAATDPPPNGGFAALMVVEEEGYTLVFSRGGEPVLHRYKGFAGALPEAARGSFVERDLRLTRNFLDEHYSGATLGPVLLLAPPESEPTWLDRLEEGLGTPAAPLDGRHLPPLRAEDSGVPPWRDLAPMLGAARREVA
ncbi:MAG TPA: hypothetical protein VF173_37265 [Thermoanaerobaculia bacterium]|nr:hypothetical protein [Thermoanaerobaculia bacterium]